MPEEIEFLGFSIADLIGVPAVAIVKANDLMAKEQVKLLMKMCFSKRNDIYEPVMIKMSIHRGVIESGNDEDNDSVLIRQTSTYFQVPLITLLPINSLAIEKAQIEFDMDVHYQYQDTSSGTNACDLVGSIKHKSRDLTEGATDDGSRDGVSISLSTAQLPLPLGVISIVQAYSKSIYPLDDSPEQKTDQKE